MLILPEHKCLHLLYGTTYTHLWNLQGLRAEQSKPTPPPFRVKLVGCFLERLTKETHKLSALTSCQRFFCNLPCPWSLLHINILKLMKQNKDLSSKILVSCEWTGTKRLKQDQAGNHKRNPTYSVRRLVSPTERESHWILSAPQLTDSLMKQLWSDMGGGGCYSRVVEKTDIETSSLINNTIKV